MIGKDFQGQGYGRASFQALLDRILEEYDTSQVQLNYHPNKEDLRSFYASFGFKDIEILPCNLRSEGKMWIKRKLV